VAEETFPKYLTFRQLLKHNSEIKKIYKI